MPNSSATSKNTAIAMIERRISSTTESWDWQVDALCRGQDSEIFFSPSGEGRSARRAREDRAKQVCAGCGVIDECRRFALAANEPFGVWGGTTARERQQHRANSRRAEELQAS
ncbi:MULTISPECIES: WhiB family transcriptional regulator [unclassified Rhodococcus (in: high G+C Gram-positive bacteria)]|jgi:WhiB family redox-sensing transcriptional regulator|uniref:WhiB family transcriptional regulator n=1 Tax=unclassified Rhodococcus (in: high G+C Gram-positive bacteria) TaxID=192944 RepID=UPI0026D8D801